MAWGTQSQTHTLTAPASCSTEGQSAAHHWGPREEGMTVGNREAPRLTGGWQGVLAAGWR